MSRIGGRYAGQGHSRSLIPIESPYDFLLEVSTNWHESRTVSICYGRLLVICSLSTKVYRFLTHSRSEWTHERRTVKFGVKKIGPSLCRVVQNTFPYLEPFKDRSWWRTVGWRDVRTDGQTELPLAIERSKDECKKAVRRRLGSPPRICLPWTFSQGNQHLNA